MSEFFKAVNAIVDRDAEVTFRGRASFHGTEVVIRKFYDLYGERQVFSRSEHFISREEQHMIRTMNWMLESIEARIAEVTNAPRTK